MRALLSVSDKSGIVPFATALIDRGWEIVSTGGTHAALQAEGVSAHSVSDVTGFPEILDGRVKTLHPRIHAGLLARSNRSADRATLAAHGIVSIQLIACNLYPFEATIANASVTDDEAIEQIDIGGPAMIRAAAKNHEHVLVITSPSDYESTLLHLDSGEEPDGFRRGLAAKAFAHVSAYDALVADYLGRETFAFPQDLCIFGRKAFDLRYGENPQQRAAAYRRLSLGAAPSAVLDAVQLKGKQLSFNNLLDADAAMAAVVAFDRPAAALVKHTIPCGLAVAETVDRAFAAARSGDPVSAFGGIVALNRPVDAPTARMLAGHFLEVVIAPGFENAALDLLAKKQNLRLLKSSEPVSDSSHGSVAQVRELAGGLLVQTADAIDSETAWTCQTRRPPTEQESRDLGFAWRAVRHVKSNAIVLARNEAVIGVGSGQPNRLESVRIAVAKAADRAIGSVLASDAFFPFADGPEEAAAAGITAIIQPGGSVRDPEVIAAADRAGMAMLFTGVRHFLH